MKEVVAAFNQEKAPVGAFTLIVQLHRLIVYAALHITDNSVHNGRWRPGPGVGARRAGAHLNSGSRQLLQCPGLASLVSLCQSGQYPPRACAPPLMGATVNWSLITGVGPNLSQIYWLYSPIPFYKWPINAVRAVMRGPATSPTLHFASVVTSRAITNPRPATLCTREVE